MRFPLMLAVFLLGAAAVRAEEEPVPEPAPAPPNPRAVIQTNHGEIEVELFADETPKTVANFLGLAEGTKTFKDPRSGEDEQRPYYDGLTFHRVIKGFMIQGGCPRGDGTGDPGFKFEDEINAVDLGLDKKKVVQAGGAPHPWLLIRSQADQQRVILGPLFKSLGIASQEDFDKRRAEVKKALDTMTLKDAYENLGYRYSTARPSHPPVKGSLAMANSGPNTNGSQFFINLGPTPHLTGKHTVFGKVVAGMDVVEKIGSLPVGAGAKPVEPVTILSIREKKPEPEPAPAPED